MDFPLIGFSSRVFELLSEPCVREMAKVASLNEISAEQSPKLGKAYNTIFEFRFNPHLNLRDARELSG